MVVRAHEDPVPVPIDILRRDGGRPVGRPVVDDDHLELAEGLRLEAVEALREIVLDVVHRHDHGQPRLPSATQPNRHGAERRRRRHSRAAAMRTADGR